MIIICVAWRNNDVIEDHLRPLLSRGVQYNTHTHTHTHTHTSELNINKKKKCCRNLGLRDTLKSNRQRVKKYMKKPI